MLEPTPLFGGNAAFLDALYEQYLRDPASVEDKWRRYFDSLPGPKGAERPQGPVEAALAERARQAPSRSPPYAPWASDGGPQGEGRANETGVNAKQAAVSRLIQVWTNRGHLVAKLDPLGLTQRPRPQVLDLEYFGLVPADLTAEFFTASRTGAVPERMKLREILKQLETIYAGPIGAEFAHMSESRERLWLQDRFQSGRLLQRFTSEDKRNILWQLTAAEGLERNLHTKYVGQKRFSLEGGETLVPLLDDLIQSCGRAKIEEVVIGMAHRGRLNILVNLLGKSPATLFSEFEGA
jgi:2-oxoglutarate dehydrogenase E1 component